MVSAETHDAFEGAIQTERDMPSEKLNFPYLNPQNGPIYVNGAEKGDCLAVYIKSIVPRGPQPRGTTVLMPEFGGLVPTADTALLTEPLPERVKKLHVDAETGVQWNDRITLPYEPFIGTIGTAPEIEAISSLVPDYYGGNMDLPDVAPGAVIYLPVNTKGAYLYLGDCHAAQGDGELCGVAVEHPTVTTVQIDLIKGWTIKHAALGERELLHDGRLVPPDGGRRARGLSRADPLARQGFRLRGTRRLHAAHPVRPHPPRQYGRSQIHGRRVHPEIDRRHAALIPGRPPRHGRGRPSPAFFASFRPEPLDARPVQGRRRSVRAHHVREGAQYRGASRPCR